MRARHAQQQADTRAACNCSTCVSCSCFWWARHEGVVPLPANPVSLHVDEVPRIMKRCLGGGEGEMPSIMCVVWGEGVWRGSNVRCSRDARPHVRCFGWGWLAWVVAFDVDDTPGLPRIVFWALFAFIFLKHPLCFKDPREGLRGCFCWLGEDWSHTLQSI